MTIYRVYNDEDVRKLAKAKYKEYQDSLNKSIEDAEKNGGLIIIDPSRTPTIIKYMSSEITLNYYEELQKLRDDPSI